MAAIILFLIPICSFYGTCVFLTRKLFVSPFDSPFLVTSLLLICIYLASFSSILTYIIFGLLITGIYLFFVELVNCFLKKQNTRSKNFLLPIWLHAFFVSIVAVIIFYNNINLHYWDDFTHWGLIPKLTYIFGRLPIESQYNIYPDYLPGAGLFSYFFVFPHKILGQAYNEKFSLISQNIIIFSCLILFLRNIFQKKILSSLIFLLMIILNFSYTEGFSTLMIEHVIGFYFAACIYIIFFCKNKKSIYIALLGAMALSTLKSQTQLLTFIVLAIATVDILFRRLQRVGVPTNESFFNRKILKLLFFIFLSFLTALTIKYMWKNYTEGIPLIYDTNMDFKEIFEYFNNPNSEHLAVITAYIKLFLPNLSINLDFLKHPTNNPFNFIFYFVLLTSFLMTFFLVKSPRLQILIICLYFGFVLFCIELLLFYLHALSHHYALKFPSFGRFLAPYFICLLVTTVYLITEIIPKNTMISWFLIVCLTIPFLTNKIPIVRIRNFLRGSNDIALVQNFRNSIKLDLNYIRNNALDLSKIILVWQCPKSLEPLIISYELIPFSLSRLTHLGPKCPVDLNMENISSTFKNINFKDYDYLLVGKSNIWFHKTYGKYLENLEANSSFMLYKITAIDDEYKFELQ